MNYIEEKTVQKLDVSRVVREWELIKANERDRKEYNFTNELSRYGLVEFVGGRLSEGLSIESRMKLPPAGDTGLYKPDAIPCEFTIETRARALIGVDKGVPPSPPPNYRARSDTTG